MQRGRTSLVCLSLAFFLGGCDAGPSDPVALPTDGPGIATLGTDVETDAARRPRRIILFSMDTARAETISGYGDAETTPNLSAIAEQGYLFRDFYSASTYTLPSHMSIFTGLDPAEHGVVNELAQLGPEVGTLALWLSKAGYRTQAFHEGAYVDARFGFDRGFGAYEKRPFKQLVSESLWGILEWIREAGDEPYFLFLHTYAPHYPYGGFQRYRTAHPERQLPSDQEIEDLRRRYPPETKQLKGGPASRNIPQRVRNACTLYNELSHNLPEFLACGDNMFQGFFPGTPHFEDDRAAMLRNYEDWIRRSDRALGLIRDTLIETGHWDDTLLIVTSDHGEAFFEHGLGKHDYVPFNEVIRVPLVIAWNRGLPGGRVVEGLAWHLDLAPTILSLAGVPVPPHLRGLDLAPAMRDQETIPSDRTIFPWLLRPANRPFLPSRRIALRKNMKYIEGHEAFGDAEGLLFDLGTSPGEQENLRAHQPEEAARLQDALDAWGQSLESGKPVHQKTGQPISPVPGQVVSPFDLPEKTRNELRAMGYL